MYGMKNRDKQKPQPVNDSVLYIGQYLGLYSTEPSTDFHNGNGKW